MTALCEGLCVDLPRVVFFGRSGGCALAELLRVCRRELRIYPAHTITLPTRVHPYVEPLLADLPPEWEASLEPTAYDQGAIGETPMLRLIRL